MNVKQIKKFIVLMGLLVISVQVIAPTAVALKNDDATPRQSHPGPEARNLTLRVTTEDNLELVGELFLPAGQAPYPAIIFTHGSEPGKRTNRGYRTWAERFRSRGVAALVFDKRGVGDSEGSYVEAPDLNVPAADLLAWVDLLMKRSEIDDNQIGVLGWSQGGWVGPLAASQTDHIQYVVSISGPGVSPLEQNIYDKTNRFEATGASVEQVQQFNQVIRLVWTYLATGEDEHLAQAAWDKVKEEPWFKDHFNGAPMGNREKLLKHPRLQYFAEHNAYDPVPVLQQVTVPMLAVFGGADRIVPVEASIVAFQAAFGLSGNSNLTTKVFPGGNHGVAVRHQDGSLRPSDEFFDTILSWVLDKIDI